MNGFKLFVYHCGIAYFRDCSSDDIGLTFFLMFSNGKMLLHKSSWNFDAEIGIIQANFDQCLSYFSTVLNIA